MEMKLNTVELSSLEFSFPKLSIATQYTQRKKALTVNDAFAAVNSVRFVCIAGKNVPLFI